MSKKYEVTVDGETEEFTTKKDVTETLLEAVADGEEHEVVVEQVDTNAVEEEEVSDNPTVTNPDNPTATLSGGTDAMGVAHLR